MSISFKVDTSDIDDFIRVLENLPEMTAQESMVAMRKAVAEVDRQTIPRTPSNTGALRGAWTTRVTRGTTAVKGIVENPKEYAIVMEKGRRPGAKMPPPDAIQYWVTRKFGVRGKEAESLAFVIARSIGRKGIEGRKMLEQGFEASEPLIRRLFDDVPRRVVNRMK
jgi:hypothetical protein